MNSNFKFVQSVDAKHIPAAAVNPKFSKLTLATTRTIAVQSTKKDPGTGIQMTETISHTTKRRTTLTTPMADEHESEPVPCAQQPKILLCESTIGQEDDDDSGAAGRDASILTDDDTVGSGSIDSQEIEAGLKEMPPPSQDEAAHHFAPMTLVGPIDAIGDTRQSDASHATESNGRDAGPSLAIEHIATQMESLSFISPFDVITVRGRAEENVQRLSHQLERMDLLPDKSDGPDRSAIDEAGEVTGRDANCSVQTLSSTASSVNKGTAPPDIKHDDSDVVIVLSDSDSSQSVPTAVGGSVPSENDGAVYNTSSVVPKAIVDLDSEVMRKVNHFFDNAPFAEPAEDSFNTTQLSKSANASIFVSETTSEGDDSGGVVDKTASEMECPIVAVERADSQPPKASENGSGTGSGSGSGIGGGDVEKVSAECQTDISDNNIMVDIPVIKSSSDQPPSIRSTGGVRLKAHNSSPIIKLNSVDGQINISAKFKLNIQIAPITDSSSDASSDKGSKGSKSTKSSDNAIESSDGQSANAPTTKMNDVIIVVNAAVPEEKPKTDTAKTKSANVLASPKTPMADRKTSRQRPETPSTASKLKQFEFQAPRSLTKTKPNEAPATPVNKPIQAADKDANKSAFKADTNIPVSAKDQKLLFEVYGEAWKTPDMIRSYAALKNKPVDRQNGESTPAAGHRYSRGFQMFKRNICESLESTRIEHMEEISIIEAPDQQKDQPKTKSTKGTPRPKKPEAKAMVRSSTKKVLVDRHMSPSVINRPAAPMNDSSLVHRPRRNVARKKLAISSSDDSEKENAFDDSGSDWEKSSASEQSSLITDDDSDSEASGGTRRSKGSKMKVPTKRAKNRLTYLNLSEAEVFEVDDDNASAVVSEEDMANITKRFLAADLDDTADRPQKKGPRKLFDPKAYNYNRSDGEDNDEAERKAARTRSRADKMADQPVSFTHKLFDGRSFGSPTTNKTPRSTAKDQLRRPISTTKKNVDQSAAVRSPYFLAKKPMTLLRSLDASLLPSQRPAEYRKYVDNFKGTREDLTMALFNMYNEQVFEGKLEMPVQWNKKLLTTAGRFIGSSKPAIKPNRIELSEKVLTSGSRLRCTLIHEMCHAAAWIFDKDRGHGPKWRAWAKRAMTAFPELPPITVCHDYAIEYKYTYKCDMCNSKSGSHSKSKKVDNIRCSHCHGSISIFLNKKQNGETVLVPVRKANGFANYVKETYKTFKKPGVSHADVMRQISTQFAGLSQEEKQKY